MRVLAVALAATLLMVAGCSDGPKAQAQSTSDPEIDYGVEATSTTGVIRGYVVDEAIRPIANVVVTLQALNVSKTTADDGAFGFDGLEPGTYFLSASKLGFASVQTSAEVVAGESEPPVTKISLVAIPGQSPYVEAYNWEAFITCGFAVVASSVGCNTYGEVGAMIGDRVYFPLGFTTLPQWIQGELVWQTTQPAGGMAIWQMAGCDDTSTDPTGNNYCDAPSSQASPALTAVGGERILENEKSMLERGVQFNIFGGPHEACNVVFYGCGVTLQQKYTVYAHVFYNFQPAEGWRFYYDGEPQPPQ